MVYGKKRFLKELLKSRELIKLNKERTKILNEKMLEIRSESSKFKNLLNSAPDPILIFDSDDRIRMVNKASCDLTGYTVHELLALRMDALIPERFQKARKEFYKNFTGVTEFKVAERIIFSKELKEIPIELSLSQLKMHGKDYICACFRDITEKKELDRKLIEKDHLYRFFYNNSLQMHLSIDPETGNILKFNKTFLSKTGYSLNDVIGKHIIDIYCEDSQPIATKLFERFKQGEEIINEELKIVRKNGQYIDVLLSVKPVKDINGNTTFSQSTLVDITDLKSKERELLKHQQRFVESQQVSKIGTWEVDSSNEEIYWSEQMYRIFEIDYNPEMNYNDIWKIIHPEDIPKIKLAWEKAEGEVVDYNITYRLCFPNKRIKYVTALGKPKLAADGKIKMIGTLRDVTDDVEKENRLKQIQRRLIDSQHMTKVGTWEVDFNTGENYWSSEMYLIFGVDENNFIISPEKTMELIHPLDRDKVMDVFNTSVESGTAYSMVFRTINGKFIHGRGELKLNDQNEPEKILGTMADITASKEAELKLVENEIRLENSQKIAHIGSWEWDTVDNSVYWSDELYRIFEKNAEIFTPDFESYLKLVHPDDINRTSKLIAKSLEQKTPFSFTHKIITGKGKVKHLECKGEISIRNGKVVKVLGTALDISESVKKEEDLIKYSQQLEYKNSELEQFAYIASHDLQEPLHTVMSFTNLLSEKYSDKIDDTGKQSFDFMLEATNRMKKLITGLLEYSRIGRELKDEDIEVNQCLENIQNDMKSKIEEENVGVVVHPNLPAIKGNPTEIRLLFQNLISNAIKFKKEDENCSIEIGCEPNVQWNKFYVKDNGIGIDEQYKEKIFVIFQRLHTRDQYKGTGIGLSHCKKIVELHGGKIWFESTLDKGTTFYFTFPK